MDSGLNLSEEERGEGGKTSTSFLKDTFNNAFPYYLAIGMSYDEFWNEDVDLVKAYVKADELKRDRVNQQMWLQGAYIYEALIKTVPIANAPYIKGKLKLEPYAKEPYELNTQKRDISKTEKTMNKNKLFMETFMSNFNRKEVKDERHTNRQVNHRD